jgi:hypothetical protein
MLRDVNDVGHRCGGVCRRPWQLSNRAELRAQSRREVGGCGKCRFRSPCSPESYCCRDCCDPCGSGQKSPWSRWLFCCHVGPLNGNRGHKLPPPPRHRGSSRVTQSPHIRWTQTPRRRALRIAATLDVMAHCVIAAEFGLTSLSCRAKAAALNLFLITRPQIAASGHRINRIAAACE